MTFFPIFFYLKICLIWKNWLKFFWFRNKNREKRINFLKKAIPLTLKKGQQNASDNAILLWWHKDNFSLLASSLLYPQQKISLSVSVRSHNPHLRLWVASSLLWFRIVTLIISSSKFPFIWSRASSFFGIWLFFFYFS